MDETDWITNEIVTDAALQAMNYRCKHCGKTVKRISDKRWIKSYCNTTGKTVHLIREKQ